MMLGRIERAECSEISALASGGIALPRIKPIFAGFKSSNHFASDGRCRSDKTAHPFTLRWRIAKALWVCTPEMEVFSAPAGRHVYRCRTTKDPSSVRSGIETGDDAPLGLFSFPSLLL